MTMSDKRDQGRQYPVGRLEFVQQSWDTGDGHAAKTASLNINGTVYRMDVIISSVTANPTVSITFTNANSIVYGNELDQAALTDGTSHYFDTESSKDDDADFNPVCMNDYVTVSIDPSVDPGGSDQTLTVDVILYVR